MIRIYPKDPSGAHPTFRVPCLRLELYGCSAPGNDLSPLLIATEVIHLLRLVRGRVVVGASYVQSDFRS